jgi:hypothetical protein
MPYPFDAPTNWISAPDLALYGRQGEYRLGNSGLGARQLEPRGSWYVTLNSIKDNRCGHREWLRTWRDTLGLDIHFPTLRELVEAVHACHQTAPLLRPPVTSAILTEESYGYSAAQGLVRITRVPPKQVYALAGVIGYPARWMISNEQSGRTIFYNKLSHITADEINAMVPVQTPPARRTYKQWLRARFRTSA